MNIIIRREEIADVQAIHELTAAAFLHAPHTDHTEQFIVDALRKSEVLTLSLVAEEGSKLVGHVAISPVSISSESALRIYEYLGFLPSMILLRNNLN